MKNFVLILLFSFFIIHSQIQAETKSSIIGSYLIMKESQATLDTDVYLDNVENIYQLNPDDTQWQKELFSAYLFNSQLVDAVKLSEKHDLDGQDVLLAKLIFLINNNNIKHTYNIINSMPLTEDLKSRLSKALNSFEKSQSVTIENKRMVYDVLRSDEFFNQYFTTIDRSDFSSFLFILSLHHLVPDDDYSNMSLAEFYQRAGNNKNAIIYYLQIQSNSDLYIQSKWTVATLLVDLNEDNKSVSALSDVVKKNCDPDECDLIDGMVAYLSGNYLVSVEKFRRILSIDDASKNTCSDTAMTIEGAGISTEMSIREYLYLAYDKLDKYDNFKETILCLIQRFKISDPAIIGALNAIKNGKYGLGSVVNNNEFVNHINYLGYGMILKQDNIEKVLPLLILSNQISPNDSYLIDSIAWGYYKMGNYENAEDYITKALQLSPGDPEMLSHAGDIFLKLGHKKHAIRSWRLALQNDAGNLDERLRKELIEKIKRYVDP